STSTSAATGAGPSYRPGHVPSPSAARFTGSGTSRAGRRPDMQRRLPRRPVGDSRAGAVSVPYAFVRDVYEGPSGHQGPVRRADRRRQVADAREEAVGAAGGRAALRDRPHDEGLAAARVTGDEHAGAVG